MERTRAARLGRADAIRRRVEKVRGHPRQRAAEQTGDCNEFVAKNPNGWSGARRAGDGVGAGGVERDGPGAEAAEHRHADDRRYRLERLRRLFQRRQGPRPSDAQRRPDRRGRGDLHRLVRAGELHRRPRLVHHRPHSDPLGAVDRGRAGRPEFFAQGDADDRRVLQEERLSDLFLRQVASRRQARVLSDRARLRRDEEFRRLLRRRLCLRLHQQVVPSLVSVIQPAIREGLQREREPRRMGRGGGTTGEGGRQDHIRAVCHLRRRPGRQRGQLHQGARQ